jgi:hypothetical protein
VGADGGGGHLDHGAEERLRLIERDRRVRLAHEPPNRVHLARIRDHGQQDAQHGAAGNPQRAPELRPQRLRVCQLEADAAGPEQRLRAAPGQEGRRLVAAEVQGSHGRDPVPEQGEDGRQRFGVRGLVWPGVRVEERELRTDQADSLGPRIERRLDLGHAGGVREQAHAAAIDRGGRQPPLGPVARGLLPRCRDALLDA